MRRLWRTLLANPHLPIPAWLAFIGVVGLATGHGVAPAAMDDLPLWLVHSWTVALAAGGLFATLGCLTDRTRPESFGLALLVFGLCLYAVIVLPGTSGAGVAAILALVSVTVLRMGVLARSREADRVARRHDGDA